MELIIQKAVELGASRIVPVASKRCVVRLDEKKAQSKVKRWQAIAESAAKQSSRSRGETAGQLQGGYEAFRRTGCETDSL